MYPMAMLPLGVFALALAAQVFVRCGARGMLNMLRGSQVTAATGHLSSSSLSELCR
jgi:hypothetical protein